MRRFILAVFMMMAAASAAFAQSRCLTSEFYQARLDLYNAYGGARSYQLEKAGQPIMAPADIQLHNVGDTMTFWGWDLTIQPPVWEQAPATCRAVTDHCYIFVADDQWNINMDSADVALAAFYWEEGTYRDSLTGIYQLDTENFGAPPDELDNDDHIYIFYDGLGSYHGIVFDGYFSVFNEYTDEQAHGMDGHSNEVEMFYMSCYPGDPVSPIRISVLAHEFEHMIHWAHDADEDTWVDEGCAEYAMLLFGMPDPLIDFPNQPDNDLIAWGNNFSDYIQTFMFFTYVSDHYGGAPSLTAIVQESQNSIDGIEMALAGRGYDVAFAELFNQWVITNYYHGAGGYLLANPDSQYIYYSINPPAFRTGDVIQRYPGGPFNRLVGQWAADYVKFVNAQHDYYGLSLYFEGGVGDEFGLTLINDSLPSRLDANPLVLNNNIWQDSTIDFAGYNNVIMAVSGVGTTGSHSYTYRADARTDADDNLTLPDQGVSLARLYPNPFNQSVLIDIPQGVARASKIAIYDLSGRLVNELAGPPSRKLIWDGTDRRGELVTSGVYLFKITDGDDFKVIKGILMK